MKKRFSDICVVVLIAFIIFGVAHFWISDKYKIYQHLYKVEAYFARQTLECDDLAPEWVKALALYGISNRGALANQVAYISPEGSISYCNTGWKKGFLSGGRVDENTRFRYASLTKVVTADVILSLVASGRLKLNSTIGEYFSEVEEWRDVRIPLITIEQLLNHTAGFDRLVSGDVMFLKNKKPWCPYAIDEIEKVKLDFSPGEKQKYSNLGYCLLGVIAERVLDKPFRGVVEEKYGLSRIGMSFVDGSQLSDEVVPDFRNDEYYYQDYYKYYDFFSASSSVGLSGSASSLAQLIYRAFSENILLRQASNFEGCEVASFRGCYAHAFYIYQKSNGEPKVYIHEGYLPGSSNVLFVSENGSVLVFLSAGAPLDAMNENKFLYEKIYEDFRIIKSE